MSANIRVIKVLGEESWDIYRADIEMAVDKVGANPQLGMGLQQFFREQHRRVTMRPDLVVVDAAGVRFVNDENARLRLWSAFSSANSIR